MSTLRGKFFYAKHALTKAINEMLDGMTGTVIMWVLATPVLALLSIALDIPILGSLV